MSENTRKYGRSAIRVLLAGAAFVGALALILYLGHQSGREASTTSAEPQITEAEVTSPVTISEPTESKPEALAVQAQPTHLVTTVEETGLILFDPVDEGFRHLWMTQPGSAEATPLTQGPWEDAEPALSPDGTRVAFRSNRNGNWDLYILDLTTGDVTELTRTDGYEGHPTWSPDGRWLAYEAYASSNLDVWIIPLTGDSPPIQLTNSPGLDADPNWDPAGGRKITFVSDRDGSSDVFVADLDQPQNRLRNLTNSPAWDETDPSFSPDGTSIAYTAHFNGIDVVWAVALADQGSSPRQIGVGRHPVWSADGSALLTVLETPERQQAQIYSLDREVVEPAQIAQAGPRIHISWATATTQIVGAGEVRTLRIAPTETSQAGSGSRLSLIALGGVRAPNPSLVEGADAPFRALRAELEARSGWDVLGELEHAFVALNDPLPPGFAYNDWLYTGRAVSIDPNTIWNGRVLAVREDYGGLTYWRLYVKVAHQDGSQGEPLAQRPWDFLSRSRGDPGDYDQGGREMGSIPGGYYIDMTALAQQFGFQRQPALTNWRSFLPGARVGEFAYTEGLDWLSAMLQLYPLEAVATPTPFASPSPTPTNTPWPTPTPWWWRWQTPTIQPSPSATSAP